MSDEKLVKIELPDVLEEPAKAVAMPLATNVGTTLGDLWYLAMGGISQLAAKKRAKYAVNLEQYKKELEKKLNEIPEERRIEPKSQVVLNALADSQSCVEEESLREMFANLIAAACDADKADSVHPAFPGIIKQLSPKDAMVLQMSFKEKSVRPIIGIQGNREKGYLQLHTNIFITNTKEYSPETQSAIVACLTMLGLVKVSYDVFFANETLYDQFKEIDEYRQIVAETQRQTGIAKEFKIKGVSMQKGQIELTDFGQQFLEVCT